MIVHSNAEDGKIVFHKLPVNEKRQKAWIHAVSKGREDFEKPKHFRMFKSRLYQKNCIFASLETFKCEETDDFH